MEISETLAADLAILAQALDDAVDIVDNLYQLSANARLAVPSYQGLTLIIADAANRLAITVLETGTRDVAGTSVLVPLSASDPPETSLVLYAGQPGAFVDLAADLAWLTGYPVGEFVFDQHLSIPPETGTDGVISALSAINQAIGVLIGRGYTLEQARLELGRRAVDGGMERQAVAAMILDSIGRPEAGGPALW